MSSGSRPINSYWSRSQRRCISRIVVFAALQERSDKEIQSVTAESDEAANANGLSDATRGGEEPAAEGASDGLEQVTCSSEVFIAGSQVRLGLVTSWILLCVSADKGSAGTGRETVARWVSSVVRRKTPPVLLCDLSYLPGLTKIKPRTTVLDVKAENNSLSFPCCYIYPMREQTSAESPSCPGHLPQSYIKAKGSHSEE